MAPDPELLAVGKVVKAFGIGGELVVEPLTDSPERFRTLRAVLLGLTPDTARHVRIEKAQIGNRGVRLRLAGVPDRATAEQLVGQFLFVDKRHRISLPRGRYFVHDIVGLTVLDEHGVPRGTVRDVLKMPAHDLYVIEYGGQQYMLPAVKEFILGVDLESRTLTVHLIEGLTDGLTEEA